MLLLASLLACDSKNACERYFDAQIACLADAGTTLETDVEKQCSDYEGGAQADAYQECLADAWDRDCTTADAVTDAQTAEAECAP